MPTITTKDGTEIFYKDWGAGQPIVFSHGWPLSADDWDAQLLFFLHHGYRVIAHDRRGHGRSTQTAEGHDMDHYADDLMQEEQQLRVPIVGRQRPAMAEHNWLARTPVLVEDLRAVLGGDGGHVDSFQMGR